MAFFSNLEGTFKNFFSIGKTNKINLINSSGDLSIEVGGDEKVNVNKDTGDVSVNDVIIDGLTGDIITTESVETSIEELDSAIQGLNATGFFSWGGTGNYYSVSGTTFTLLRAGEGRIQGKLIQWAGNQDVELVANACNFIYIDNSGILNVVQTAPLTLYTNNIILFEALNDGTNIVVVKENHSCDIQAATNFVFHNTIGIVITTSTNNQTIGADITRVATGSGAAAGDRQLKMVGEAYLQDHGLVNTIPDSAGAPLTINWYYTNTSGHWTRYAQQTEALMYWNNAGTPTLLGAGKFANYRIYVSKGNLNSSSPSYFGVMGGVEYLNFTAAQTAINNGVVASYSNELYQLELAQLGYITVDNTTGGFISKVTIQKKTATSNTTASGGSTLASGINTNTATFDKLLSATDTTVQAALSTIDEYAADRRSINLIGASHIKLDPVLTVDHTGTGIIISTTVDANSYGIASALHLDTDGNWIEADADTIATMPCSALALETGTGTKKILLNGIMRDDTWNWTPGAILYVSNTVGTLTSTPPSTSGNQVQIVGLALTADSIIFNPSFNMVEIV